MYQFPESGTGIAVKGIIERTYITFTNPVTLLTGNSFFIEPALFIKLVIGIKTFVEFRPYGDHKVRMILIMYFANHALCIRESFQIKRLTAPLIFFPIRPIQHNVIQR